MPLRTCRILAIGALLLLLHQTALYGQQIHRNGFAGKQTGWIRGEDTVRGEEREHKLSEQYAHSVPTSEWIRVEVPTGAVDPALLHYFYPTSPAPMTDDLSASVWVKGSRGGVQLRGRLVLPKERNPNKPDEPFTTLVNGDRYQTVGRWQRLELARPAKLLRETQQMLRVQYSKELDFTDAFIDRLVLNLYTGPGPLDLYIDDLEIGPVKPTPPPPSAPAPAVEGGLPTPMATSNPLVTRPIKRNDLGVTVELNAERLLVGGRPFFFRAIRHTDTPLKTLRDAGFNTVWFDVDTKPETLDEAITHGFWVVPSLPLLADSSIAEGNGSVPGQLTGRENETVEGTLSSARTPQGMVTAIKRFQAGDSVLFWDMGGGRTAEQAKSVARTAQAIRTADPQRPRAADVWDGFAQYSTDVELLGTHRWPLMTSLELVRYRDWLVQRRNLAMPGTFMWTWIQTHVPESHVRLMYDQDKKKGFDEPVGPQPEQIRVLTYLAMAAGNKGLGFWSDRFLADSHQGRDRLLALALLNQEITMLEPILLSLNEQPMWIETSDPNVKAAVLKSNKGMLVLPIWLDAGMQYVPGQSAVQNLNIIVPQVPNGSQAWEITPGQVKSLHYNAERVLGGVRIVLPEFDTTAAIVFTSDLSPSGMVVKWQDHSRRVGKLTAQWAIDLAGVQYEKVLAVHQRLQGLAPNIADANQLIADSQRRLLEARRNELDGNDREAYLNAMRSMRPLRILMRTHWENAVVSTQYKPTSSVYATSFYTLPRHWEFQRQTSQLASGTNVLRSGNFDGAPQLKDPIVQVSTTAAFSLAALPGWTVEKGSLDGMEMEASIVAAKPLKPVPPKKVPPSRIGVFDTHAPERMPDPSLATRYPDLGLGCLKLTVKPPKIALTKGQKVYLPEALERTYIAVTSPWTRLQPGTLVKISGWVRVDGNIRGSADGALVFDSIGTEAMGIRLNDACSWKSFTFFRKIPDHGAVSVTCMLTGLGTVYFDDLKIEPLTNEASFAPATPIQPGQ